MMKVIAGLAFLVAGAATTIYGPLVPTLRDAFTIGDHQLGLFFTMQSATSVVAGTLSGLAVRRFGTGPTLALGYTCVAAGSSTLLGPSAWPGVLATAALIGVGLGLVIPTTNVYFARRGGTRTAAVVTLLNLAWGAGASAWPTVVRWALPDPARATLSLAGAAVLVAAALWWGRGRLESTPAQPSLPLPPAGHGPERIDAPRAGARAPMGTVLLFGAALVAYGGIETALGGWLGDFVRRSDPSAGEAWLLVPSAFYIALAAGRVALLPMLTSRTEHALALVGLALAALAQAALVAGRVEPVTLALASGAGLAGVFPITVAVATRSLGAHATIWMPPVVAMAGVGGAIVPWLVGVVSSARGSLAAGLTVPLASTLLVAAVYLFVARRDRALDAPS